MTAPLWQRALLARRLGLSPEQMAWRAATHRAKLADNCRRASQARRSHAEPKVGDLFGCKRIIACLGPGRRGRRDKSYRWRCERTGREGDAFEFNLRKAKACHSCRRSARRSGRAAAQ